MHTMVGTPYYIAPEVLSQSETGTLLRLALLVLMLIRRGCTGNRGYTNACDCWSLGVISYMLLSGTPPFKGRRDREVLQSVRRGKYTLSGPKWENVSDEAKDFIR
jgi:calcium-dependent protein kinase